MEKRERKEMEYCDDGRKVEQDPRILLQRGDNELGKKIRCEVEERCRNVKDFESNKEGRDREDEEI